MNLHFDLSLGNGYKSTSQKIRVISESWFAKNMYCPCCGNIRICHFKNNSPVADFYCENCNEQFELKSTDKKLGLKIADGAYSSAIERITSNTNPDLIVLQYKDFKVSNLSLIPKFFFTPQIIEKRNPLSPNARRAGWVGCNIIFGRIPLQGKIPIISDGKILNRDEVVKLYQKSLVLRTDSIKNRGWILDVLNCINDIKSEEFNLNDVYQYAESLKIKHPDNNNIQAKIRQQLQFLRDRNLIVFLGRGKYRKI